MYRSPLGQQTSKFKSDVCLLQSTNSPIFVHKATIFSRDISLLTENDLIVPYRRKTLDWWSFLRTSTRFSKCSYKQKHICHAIWHSLCKVCSISRKIWSSWVAQRTKASVHAAAKIVLELCLAVSIHTIQNCMLATRLLSFQRFSSCSPLKVMMISHTKARTYANFAIDANAAASSIQCTKNGIIPKPCSERNNRPSGAFQATPSL